MNPSKATAYISALFFASGFSSLIYEIVWQRVLTTIYGVGSISIAIIVGIYMLGLGIGALIGGHFAERDKNPITLYMIIELLIAIFGAVSLPFLSFLEFHTAGSHRVLSLGYIALFLFIPTFLMGMTLPILTKILNSYVRDFFITLSSLYFINTIGAACGAVVTSYVLISFWGMDRAVFCAVVINVILTFAILVFRNKAAREKPCPHVDPPSEVGRSRSLGLSSASFLVLVSGFLAIGYQIVWVRIVMVLIKDSPYAFSTILNVYLAGLAVGGLWIKRFLRRHPRLDPGDVFFIAQVLVGLSTFLIITGYYYLTKFTSFGVLTRLSFFLQHHPMIYIGKQDFTGTDILRATYYLVDIFFWPFLFIFIPALFIGAGFPLISTWAKSRQKGEGATVGVIYFFNTIGNVLGAIVTGFVLLPFLGTSQTLIIFILIGFWWMLFISDKVFRRMPKQIAFLFVCILVILTFPKHKQLYEVMHGHPLPQYQVHYEEGIDGIVMTYHHEDQLINFINGQLHGQRPGTFFYAQTLPVVSAMPKAEKVLIIGYGTGSITEAMLLAEHVKKITVVELNATLIKNLRKIDLFDKMLNHPKIELVVDDARRFLLRNNETYDLILMDPLRTRTAYSNNLYSREFFELAQKAMHLRSILMVWSDEFAIMPKTVATVFPHISLFDRQQDQFYLVSQSPITFDEKANFRLLRKFHPEEQEKIIAIHKQLLHIPDRRVILSKTPHHPINTDWRPYSEYYINIPALRQQWELWKAKTR